MDEAVGDEVTAMGATESTHIRTKDNVLKPGSSDVVESCEMVIPCEGDHIESSTHLFTDILNGRNLDRIGSSEHASVSPHCMDNTGVMVEELTVINYNSENLAVVSTSSTRDRMQTRQNQRQHLYQLAGGSGSGNLHGEIANRDKNQAASSVWEDAGDLFFPGLLDQNQKTVTENYSEAVDNFLGNDDKGVLSNMFSSGVIRTKILSKSGFPEYFVKNTLNGKGIIYRGKDRGFGEVSCNQAHSEFINAGLVGSGTPPASVADIVKPPAHGITATWPSLSASFSHGGLILRDWLEAGKNMVNKTENLRIFRQIVELVDLSHSQGVALKDLRPSCFKLLQSNRVLYLGSSIHIDLPDTVSDQDISQFVQDGNGKRPVEGDLLPSVCLWAKKQKVGDSVPCSRRWPQSQSTPDFKSATVNINKADSSLGPVSRNESSAKQHAIDLNSQSRFSIPHASDLSPQLLASVGFTLEERWYASPEQLISRCSTIASNIYSLGVLLFELLGSFDSRRSRERAMLDLSHRILPQDFLSENPKEAGFCLWLLHPETLSRPTTRKILQSEIVSSIQELPGDELLPSIDEDDAESELLFHFLSSLKAQKQRDASKLAEEIRYIEADIKGVERRQIKISPVLSSLPQDSLDARGNRFLHRGHSSLDVYPKLPPLCDGKLTRNMRQLESAYFTMRSNIQLPENYMTTRTTRTDRELLEAREKRLSRKDEGKCKNNDRLGGFFNDLCKYARYSKFKVQGILRNGDLTNSANVICSLSFDRDEDFLAAGGVSKKIKIFDFHALFDDSVDIHYPVIEMSNKSKLTCICWNSYIRNYLASTDYDGIVKLWDAATGQGFREFVEHDERAWCVDFSRVDPKKLASGSDDRLVKLWSFDEKKSLCTIRNSANVCSVQFSADSTYMVAFSSSDYKTYCYDLRNVSTPWCILAGHEKAVSYAKFLDAETVVSASTDNTLKIWDLKKTNPNGLSRDACILTLRGHTNAKNFVGLSVADGYIACGSETNEVFAYFRSLPMPITSHKFGSIDPLSGKETEDDNGQFVSSVCWRRKSNMVVATNSSGCIKLLQMV